MRPTVNPAFAPDGLMFKISSGVNNKMVVVRHLDLMVVEENGPYQRAAIKDL
jgi:hypothetical protein